MMSLPVTDRLRTRRARIATVRGPTKTLYPPADITSGPQHFREKSALAGRRPLGPEPLPALMPEAAQGFDVAFVDAFRIGKRRHGAGDAGFAQRVQGRIGRADDDVVDVIGIADGELVLRTQAGDLVDAVQLQALEQRIGRGQKARQGLRFAAN